MAQDLLPLDLKIRINDFQYTQHKNEILKEGDLVLDTRDNTHTRVEIVLDNNHVAINCGIGVEVGVPTNKLRLLKPINN